MKFNKYELFGDYHWKEYETKNLYWEHAERIKKWVKGKQILDVGAGDGLITSLINAIGIDTDLVAPKLAQTHGVTVLNASIYNIPFSHECFESVYMGDIIEHLEDIQAALKEVRRVIKNDGHVYITTPPAKMDGKLQDIHHTKEYTKSELISAVENIGFLCREANIDDRGFNIYAKFQKVDRSTINKSHNILIFSHSSRLGGAERSLITLVRELIQTHNNQVTVVLPPGGPSIDMLKAVGAEIITGPLHWWCTGEDFPTTDKIYELMYEAFDWLLDQISSLRQISPDIILTNTMVIPWGAITSVFLKKPHLWMINEFGELDHGFKFYLPFERVLRIIEDSSDVIITRSDAIKNTLFQHHNSEKFQTIYRSIDPPASIEYRDDNKIEYFNNPSACHLAIVGTIREEKGQLDALNAIIELTKNRNQQVELVMVGHIDEDYRSELEQTALNNHADKNIHILPFQNDVHRIIDQADIILVCSKLEAFGRVILESLLKKKPIIATNSGGTPEIITDRNTGLLYSPGDYLQLANQIEKLINNPLLKQKMAEEGYEFVTSTFTKEQFAGKYQNIIETAIDQKYQEKIGVCCYIVEQFQNYSSRKTQELLQLQKQNEALKQEVLTYALSKSWNLTRPFRKLVQLVKRK